MKKITILSIALMLTLLLSTAQNDRMMSQHFNLSQHPQFEQPDLQKAESRIQKAEFPKPKSQSSKKDWYEPDTLYQFLGEYHFEYKYVTTRHIFSYNTQGLNIGDICQY